MLLKSFDDQDAAGPPVFLPDGSRVPRLPSIRRFIWRDGFAGVISLRWVPSGGSLPPTCLGHVGYAVVPWRRNEGLATLALKEICAQAPFFGLPLVEVVTDEANTTSARVILNAGGAFVRRFEKPVALGGGVALLHTIPTSLPCLTVKK